MSLMLKFLLSITIPFGYLLTFEYTSDFAILYHLLIVLSTLLTIAFLVTIHGHRVITVLGYIFSITFLIGYFVQFFLFMHIFSLHQVDTAQIILGYDFTQKIFTQYSIDDFYRAFEAMSLFYCLMLLAFILLSFSRLNIKFYFQSNRNSYTTILKTLPLRLLAIGFFLLILIIFMDLGKPSAVHLPFELAGIIMLGAKYTIPFGLLSMVWLSESTKQSSNTNTIYFLYTVLLYFATLSKFVLVISFTYLYAIWLLAGTLTPARRNKILFALLIFIISYPLLNVFRIIMLSPEHFITAITQEVSWSTINIYHTISTIIMRFSGYINLLLFIHEIDVFDLHRTFDLLSGSLALNDYAGQRLMANISGMAASFFGGIYFLYGNVGIAFLITFLLILLITILLNTLQLSHLTFKPVVYLLLISQTVLIFVDGINFPSLIHFLVPLMASIIIFEFLLRKKHV